MSDLKSALRSAAFDTHFMKLLAHHRVVDQDYCDGYAHSILHRLEEAWRAADLPIAEFYAITKQANEMLP